jgi:hypothetical protein
MELKCKNSSPGRLASEGAPVPIVQQDVWVPQAVMIFCRRGGTFARTDTRSQQTPARNVVAVPKHVTPYGIHKLVIAK